MHHKARKQCPTQQTLRGDCWPLERVTTHTQIVMKIIGIFNNSIVIWIIDTSCLSLNANQLDRHHYDHFTCWWSESKKNKMSKIMPFGMLGKSSKWCTLYSLMGSILGLPASQSLHLQSSLYWKRPCPVWFLGPKPLVRHRLCPYRKSQQLTDGFGFFLHRNESNTFHWQAGGTEIGLFKA